MRSGSPETVGVSAPNTKELGRTDLQRQAVMKQGVAFSVVLKTKQQNKFWPAFFYKVFYSRRIHSIKYLMADKIKNKHSKTKKKVSNMNNMNSERFLMMPLSGEKIFQCICNAQLGNSGKNENLFAAFINWKPWTRITCIRTGWLLNWSQAETTFQRGKRNHFLQRLRPQKLNLNPDLTVSPHLTSNQ